jgi:hypothetical protein
MERSEAGFPNRTVFAVKALLSAVFPGSRVLGSVAKGARVSVSSWQLAAMRIEIIEGITGAIYETETNDLAMDILWWSDFERRH